MRTKRREWIAVGLIVVAGVVVDQRRATASAADVDTETPCVAAIVHHHEHSESADGISRDVTFRESFQRCGNHVYIARIRPQGAVRPDRHGDPHQAPDLASLPRVVERGRDGAATLEVLDREGHRVIDVDRGSFETVHFDANFERAASLVDAHTLASMSPLPGRLSPIAGARWLGRDNGTRYMRVLWDDARKIARAIESGSLAGDVKDSVRLELEPVPLNEPPEWWRGAENFEHFDFSNFGD